MPGVHHEFIKAGKFLVPVELTFQTETIKAPGDIRGLVNTSKWIERHQWKEIKAMLKPAVEACLKYNNESNPDNIPKSHHISYGREVSLGYLIIPNTLSNSFASILDPRKNCWTDDEDDEDELLGPREKAEMEETGRSKQGGEFTECIPTKTAIRVCVVRKSVVSIDDARRIRKELGVRPDDVRHYFSSTAHLNNEPGPSSMALNQFPENFDKEMRTSEWAANSMYAHLRDSGNIGISSQSHNIHSSTFFNSDQQGDERESHITDDQTASRVDDGSSDSEVENIPRRFGALDEIRVAAQIYNHVLHTRREVDSGEDPDDDLSLPDIDPNPPVKKKKNTRTRKKSTSLSPSKSKRLTHNNILSMTQDGQGNFSEEDSPYTKKSTKRAKRKRTVAVVEPIRTLPNGQMSFEQAIGALGTEKRRKARPGSSHGTEKAHTGGGRSKQTPAIDIIAPDDDRLTITTPPEPMPAVTPSTSMSMSMSSPTKEVDLDLEFLKEKERNKKKRKKVNIDDDPHKWERLTPSPLFDDNDDIFSEGNADMSTASESDLEMPLLIKMVDSDEEKSEGETKEEKDKAEKEERAKAEAEKSRREEEERLRREEEQERLRRVEEDERARREEEERMRKEELARTMSAAAKRVVEQRSEKPEVGKQVIDKPQNDQSSPDITQVKVKHTARKRQKENKSFVRKLDLSQIVQKMNEGISVFKSAKSNNTNEVVSHTSNKSPPPKPKETTRTTSPSVLKASSAVSEIAKPNLSVNSEKVEKKRVTSPVLRSKSPAYLKQTSAFYPNSPMKEFEKSSQSTSTSGETFVDKRKTDESIEEEVADRRKVKKNKLNESSLKTKRKPKMGDAQTQTEDLQVVAHIVKKRSTPTIINNPTIKISRSCEVSSEDEFFDVASHRSRTPASESGHPQNIVSDQLSQDASSTDLYDDDGLFSFDSPTVPNLSLSQTSLSQVSSPESVVESPPAVVNNEYDDDIIEEENSFEEPVVEENISEELGFVEETEIGTDYTPTNQNNEDVFQRPESPQPGCSHWIAPISRPVSPPLPTLTSSILMPPPLARPPRTPRKFVCDQSDESSPPRLTVSSPEHMLYSNSTHAPDSEDESMPVGTEAVDVSNNGNIYQVLNQPEVFKTGMKLIEKVKKKPSSANAIGRKLNIKKSESSDEAEPSAALVPLSNSRSKRALSPDICDIVPDKRLRMILSSRRSRRNTLEESRNNPDSDVEGNLNGPQNAVALRRNTDDEMSDVEGTSVSVMDYFQRLNNPDEYQPQGDEFDLSQKSYCMLDVIPHYPLKSRMYKINAKNVRETSIKQIIEHFNVILPELFGIFEGKVKSYRHKVFVEGYGAKRALRDLSVTLPFTGQQCTSIATLIYDKLVPDKSMRCEYMDYVSLVLLPEAFIRIYSRINNVRYEMAETEMKYRACYDGEVPQEYRNLQTSTPELE